MNWQAVAQDSPKALEAFESWARTKSIITGWLKYTKGGLNRDTSFALLVGPLMVFFREQDIVFSYHVTKHGRVHVMTHRPDRRGHYKVTRRTFHRVDPLLPIAAAFADAFKFLEARINGHEEIPEHTEELIQES